VRYTIIIPCYNEAERLPVQAILDFKKTHPDSEILLVNDGSSDETLSIITGLKSSGISFLNLEKNVGKAEAVRKGMEHLLSSGASEYIGYFDADLSTPLEEADKFMEVFKSNAEVQIVMGSRIKRMGAEINRFGYRHYTGRIFATFASNILTIGIYDTQCGAKMIKSSLLEKVISEPFSSRWLFDVELMARIIIELGYNKSLKAIYEFPLNRWNEIAGSKISLKNLIRFPTELFIIYRKYHHLIKRKRDDELTSVSL
jgi:dolichyl-phosphate beta-glucosyltransferase